MKFCVFGAGDISGYLGVQLALAGNDVTLIARGKNLEAIRKDGMKLLIGFEERVVKDVFATDDTDEAGPQDYVIVATKAHQWPALTPPTSTPCSPWSSSGRGWPVYTTEDAGDPQTAVARYLGRWHWPASSFVASLPDVRGSVTVPVAMSMAAAVMTFVEMTDRPPLHSSRMLVLLLTELTMAVASSLSARAVGALTAKPKSRTAIAAARKIPFPMSAFVIIG